MHGSFLHSVFWVWQVFPPIASNSIPIVERPCVICSDLGCHGQSSFAIDTIKDGFITGVLCAHDAIHGRRPSTVFIPSYT